MLFTFPSRYCFTIGRISFLALEGGPPCFPPDCSCPVVLRIPAQPTCASPTGLSPSLVRCSNRFGSLKPAVSAGPTTPKRPKPLRFGLCPVRSPLLWASRLISSRQATEMFQFAHVPLPSLSFQEGVSRHHSGGVAPFGISRLIACMQLPLNVSPVSASFFGLMRQGIHLVLSLICAWRGFPNAHASAQASPLPLSCLLFSLGTLEVFPTVQLFRYGWRRKPRQLECEKPLLLSPTGPRAVLSVFLLTLPREGSTWDGSRLRERKSLERR